MNEGAPPGGNPGFRWEDFQNRFFGDGHWRDSLRPDGAMPWVEEYVRGLIADVVPGASETGPPPSSRTSSFTGSVFETHQQVIARIRLPLGGETELPRVRASIHELQVETADGQRRTLKLPCFVRPDGARAVWKEDILEVRLPKEGNPRYRDIPVVLR